MSGDRDELDIPALYECKGKAMAEMFQAQTVARRITEVTEREDLDDAARRELAMQLAECLPLRPPELLAPRPWPRAPVEAWKEYARLHTVAYARRAMDFDGRIRDRWFRLRIMPRPEAVQ